MIFQLIALLIVFMLVLVAAYYYMYMPVSVISMPQYVATAGVINGNPMSCNGAPLTSYTPGDAYSCANYAGADKATYNTPVANYNGVAGLRGIEMNCGDYPITSVDFEGGSKSGKSFFIYKCGANKVINRKQHSVATDVANWKSPMECPRGQVMTDIHMDVDETNDRVSYNYACGQLTRNTLF